MWNDEVEEERFRRQDQIRAGPGPGP